MKRFLPFLFILLGAAFIFFGISRGEVSVVLQKSIRICLECIGLG